MGGQLDHNRESSSWRVSDKGARDRTMRHIFMLFLAFVSLSVFVIFQQSAIVNPNFLFLMFSSLFFLGVGTFLLMITFVKSSGVEKSLCLGIAIVFIVATLFVASSLAQVPRGGLIKNSLVTPENLTLTARRVQIPFSLEPLLIIVNYKGGSHSQVLYSADYPVAGVSITTYGEIEIRRNPYLGTETLDPINVTLHFWWRLRPYQQSWYSRWETVLFSKNQRWSMIQPYIALDWGSLDLANRTRLDGYDLEFIIDFYAYSTQLGPYLNFTVDMSDFRIGIRDFVVDSKFQNGLGITLSGIFIGINCYIPGKLLSELLSRKKRVHSSHGNFL